jgi:hypothetical protein
MFTTGEDITVQSSLFYVRVTKKHATTPYVVDQVLKITGRLYTGQIGRLSDGTGENFDPDAAEITRFVQTVCTVAIGAKDRVPNAFII